MTWDTKHNRAGFFFRGRKKFQMMMKHVLESTRHSLLYSVFFAQPTWTHPTGNSLMFVGTTLASSASGPAWSSRWCHLLEPWWFTGSSCPTFFTTQDNLFTVSCNATVSDKKELSRNYVVTFAFTRKRKDTI